MRCPWHEWLPLQEHMLPFGLGLLLLACVLLYTIDELLPRSRKRNVFDADVHSLFDVSVPNTLVNDDPDCALRDVVDDASLAMVDFVRHTIIRGQF